MPLSPMPPSSAASTSPSPTTCRRVSTAGFPTCWTSRSPTVRRACARQPRPPWPTVSLMPSPCPTAAAWWWRRWRRWWPTAASASWSCTAAGSTTDRPPATTRPPPTGSTSRRSRAAARGSWRPPTASTPFSSSPEPDPTTVIGAVISNLLHRREVEDTAVGIDPHRIGGHGDHRVGLQLPVRHPRRRPLLPLRRQQGVGVRALRRPRRAADRGAHQRRRGDYPRPRPRRAHAPRRGAGTWRLSPAGGSAPPT